jgi:hypothetical protein
METRVVRDATQQKALGKFVPPISITRSGPGMNLAVPTRGLSVLIATRGQMRRTGIVLHLGGSPAGIVNPVTAIRTSASSDLRRT